MRYILLSLSTLLLCAAVYAQDVNERAYLYESLTPQRNTGNIPPKPKVEGWASERVKENLDRGLVAVKTDNGVYLSWRLLETDDPSVAFNVYRSKDGKNFSKINGKPVSATTDFTDKAGKEQYFYQVRSIVKGKTVETSSAEKVLAQNYLSVKFQGEYPCQKLAVGDLNGDGKYDYIIKQPNQVTDPGSWRRSTDTFKIEAYLADGTFLWRKDLGWNIEQGVWYSPYVVADLNGDGKAEVIAKTAPTDKDYRDETGRVPGIVPYNNKGVAAKSPYGPCPEYCSVFDGMTGEELDRVPWIEGGQEFGDYNRNNRQQMTVAYLDGKTPCVIVLRGTYRKMAADAYQMVDGKLQLLWRWNGDQENPIIRSQGAHQTVCCDIDNDGREEIVLGSVVLDDNGQALWSVGLGHPDKMIVADIDPDNEGLEVLYGIEVYHEKRGVSLVDGATGKCLWDINHYTGHVGDAMAADLFPEIPGLECFAAEDSNKSDKEGPKKYLLDCKGNVIDSPVPGCRNWIWWDADNLREQPAGMGRNGLSIVKYQGETVTEGIQGQIMLTADLFGDWREEIVTVSRGEIRVYTTTIPAKDRRVTLMQDPLYRSYVCDKSMGYDQSPMTSFNF